MSSSAWRHSSLSAASEPFSQTLYWDRFTTKTAPVSPPTKRYDFISFLAAVQRRNVDFLAISWQPGLASVGAGATAEIRQALISLQTSFAFKRSQPSYAVNDVSVFRELESEVMVLGHHKIRDHPNIINLEGIGWEVRDGENKVWPVLVFEKAPHQDLRRFLGSDDGRAQSAQERLRMCGELASAIMTMHLCGLFSQ
jgi:hypothetical protein